MSFCGSGSAKRLFAELYDGLKALDARILAMDSELQEAFRQNVLCQRIAAVAGIGPVTATAAVAAVANGSDFRKRRQFAAWIGLVPRGASQLSLVEFKGAG